MIIRADMHIHTCLSPCADKTMRPKAIIEKARERGLGMIAISDHNTCGNYRSVAAASGGTGITVLPAIEASSQEEVHTLAVFGDLEACLELQNYIFKNLSGLNDASRFGQQVLVDPEGTEIGVEDKFLLGAVQVSIETMVSRIKELGGIAIASHIDREAYGILGQLGFIPEGLKLDALELSGRIDITKAREKFKGLEYPFVTFSDAHTPEDIGSAYTEVDLKEASFDAFREHMASNMN